MRTEQPKIKVHLPDVVGKGYGTFWRFKGRYRVVKGSRASKKSKTTALWFIVNMMAYPDANTLVVRKTFRTLKDSCFTELKWAVHRLKVDAWWEFKESPLEATYTPTGQKIYFRGLDDPLKVTSITVDVGVLCWAWLEEAYEVMKEDDFNVLDESIRGEVPETDDGCAYVIYWFVDRIDKDNKKIKRIQVWDKQQAWFFCQEDDGSIVRDDSIPNNPRPHILYQKDGEDRLFYDDYGMIPFFRLDNGKKRFSGLKTIKALIDDYDLMNAGLSNNIQDTNEALYVVKGFDGDNLDELHFNVRAKKLIGVGKSGDVDIKTIDIPVEARKTKMEVDEKNIFRFGQGVNTEALKDTSATTSIAIKSAYANLDLKCDGLQPFLLQFMRKLLKLVLKEINDRNGTDYEQKDVYFDFEREIITNAQENAQIDLVSDNLRGLTRIQVAEASGMEDATDNIFKGGNLLDEIIPFLEEKGIGHTMDWNPDDMTHTFRLYKGRDLTAGIHAIVFSEEQGSAKDLVINDDDSTLCNVAYVQGSLSGTDNTFVEIVGDVTGDNRREVWFKTAVRQENDESAADCKARARAYGQMELGKRIRRKSFSVSIDPEDLGKYYALGDIVSCVSARFGVSFSARITGIKYTLDSNKARTEVILGDPILTALGAMKLNG